MTNIPLYTKKKENSLKYLLHHPNYYDRTYVILSFLIPPFGIILSIILNDVDRSQTNRTYGQSEMGGSCSSAAVFGLITYGLILIVILNLTAS